MSVIKSKVERVPKERLVTDPPPNPLWLTQCSRWRYHSNGDKARALFLVEAWNS